MSCKHPENNGHWKQDAIWVCHDCDKEFRQVRYFCTNCETDDWITCKIDEESK